MSKCARSRSSFSLTLIRCRLRDRQTGRSAHLALRLRLVVLGDVRRHPCSISASIGTASTRSPPSMSAPPRWLTVTTSGRIGGIAGSSTVRHITKIFGSGDVVLKNSPRTQRWSSTAYPPKRHCVASIAIGSRDDEGARFVHRFDGDSQRSLTHGWSGVRWTITDTGDRKVDMDIGDGERGLGPAVAPGIIHHGFPALLTSPIAFASFNRTFQNDGNHHPDRRRAQRSRPTGAA